ncbi:hypothetical protein SUGI_1515530 [Cryptomeria japonica]|uniref:Uncharacterized protein n=1 Tax=Cryptomeria japonica TaxID=3369 RepID=A0AAD3NPK7_CRYJA|nr:hypothetical protein SUGI_1515530 [Cryptomeria japonica]
MFDRLRWAGPNRSDNADELEKRHKVSEVSPDSNQWDLEFIKPTSDDSGTYYCIGTYHNSDKLNASVQVAIYNPVTIDSCHVRQFLLDGQSGGKIACTISGDSSTVWLFKDNLPLSNYNNRYKWNNDDAIVVNGEVNQTDAGIYSIKIRDGRGQKIEQNIEVQVHSKPQIFNDTNQIQFHGIDGEPAQLQCLASGVPKPLVTWLDPKLRNLTKEAGYITNQESGILIIDKVNRNTDEGEFQCTANNNVGEASRKVSMLVYTRPIIDTFIDQTVDEGTEVTFDCRARGHPKPEFSIRKHGNNQQSYRVGNPQFKDMDIQQDPVNKDLYTYRLTIIATQFNFGLHYCNATNEAGTAERSNNLFVRYKPDLSLTPREQHVRLGKKISYTCHIKGYPKPVVTWKIEGVQVVHSNATFLASRDQQTHIGTMSPPDQQQAGKTITCIALNDMGITEQNIIPKFTTTPGQVIPTLLARTPTTVKLLLNVNNDGGERIRAFRYRLEGTTLNIMDTTYAYRKDTQAETSIDASPNPQTEYTIRNLLPNYSYKVVIRAVNDMGVGDFNEFHVDTLQPTRPEPPIITKPVTSSSQHTTSGYQSQYNNGYLLEWAPPNLDNGDPVTMYIIKYNKITIDALNMVSDDKDMRTIEQMNGRPLNAKLGPLEANQRYGIQLHARNKYGDSDAATIVIYTTTDRPPMEDFEPQSSAWVWLKDTPTPTLIIFLAVAFLCLVAIDLIFCSCFQMGISHRIRGWCCPTETNSGIGDKIHT